MRTNVVIDDKLIREAMRATGLKTKRAVIEEGLRTLVQLRGQSRIRRWRGKFKWQGNLEELRAGRTREGSL